MTQIGVRKMGPLRWVRLDENTGEWILILEGEFGGESLRLQKGSAPDELARDFEILAERLRRRVPQT